MNLVYLKNILHNQKFKNFFVYGTGQAVNIVSPLLITPYIVFVCGIDKLGLIAVGQSLAYILCVIIDYSSYIIGVREISINRNNPKVLEKIFLTHYTSKFFLLLLTGLILLLLVYLVPYFNQNREVIFYSFPIIIAQFLNPTWFFQGLEKFLWISFINVLSKVLFLASVFTLVALPNDFVYVNLILGVSGTVANSIGLISIYKVNNFSFRNINLWEVKKLISDDFSFCFSQLLFAIRNYSSVVIIGFFAGDFVAGQFKVIEQIIGLLRTYLQMFFKFSYSYICLEINQNVANGLRIWKRHNGLNFIFTSALIALIVFFSTEILVFFKVTLNLIPQFENYLHIALIIPLLIAITLAMEQLIFSFNKNKPYIRITFFITLFHILGVSSMIFWQNVYFVFLFLIVTEIFLILLYSILLQPLFNKKN
ncbi:oligosaccharide flippase family protein [Flavobacterium sp.]|uniref:oligosaccharide flippase family protein n=1 Tax=Flavobacterium sp. TaxID=239 RepID=UPI0037C12076